MARERLSMKLDSKTAGKTGQLLFLQKSALCGRLVPLSPSRAAPHIKGEPAVFQITYERSSDPVKHKAHETPCNSQIGANTIGIESPRA